MDENKKRFYSKDLDEIFESNEVLFQEGKMGVFLQVVSYDHGDKKIRILRFRINEKKEKEIIKGNRFRPGEWMLIIEKIREICERLEGDESAPDDIPY